MLQISHRVGERIVGIMPMDNGGVVTIHDGDDVYVGITNRRLLPAELVVPPRIVPWENDTFTCFGICLEKRPVHVSPPYMGPDATYDSAISHMLTVDGVAYELSLFFTSLTGEMIGHLRCRRGGITYCSKFSREVADQLPRTSLVEVPTVEVGVQEASAQFGRYRVCMIRNAQ